MVSYLQSLVYKLARYIRLISLCQLHNQPSGHVQERKWAHHFLLFQQASIWRLVPGTFEVNQVYALFHFVDLNAQM